MDAIIPSKGVVTVTDDSLVLVSINAIRIANAKIIELEYERKIRKELETLVYNDSIIIKTYKEKIEEDNKRYKKEVSKVKRERNAAAIGSVAFFLLSVVMFFK